MKQVFQKYISIFIVSVAMFWTFVFSQEFSIHATWWCLTWVGEECLVIEINPDNQATPESIAQDVVMSATYMVWTVLTIAIIVSWLWYIFSSASGKDPSKYKKWLMYAAIWAVLVRWAYAIVRLLQYIARW